MELENTEEKIKENKVEDILEEKLPEKKKKFKEHDIQLIVTIGLSLIVGYAFIYTVYWIFIYPPVVIEAKILLEEQEENMPSLYDDALELVLKVPYVLGTDIVYNEKDISSFSLLNNEEILIFLLNNIDESFKEYNSECEEGYLCFNVSTEDVDSMSNDYFANSLTFEQSLDIQNGTCTLDTVSYSCIVEDNNTYYGKISLIELVTETEENLVIYESVLFVSSLDFDETGTTSTFDIVSTSPLLEDNISALGTLNILNGLASEILNYYYGISTMYKHTFIEVDGTYVWSETEFVTGLPN